jgi:hypothetical protein
MGVNLVAVSGPYKWLPYVIYLPHTTPRIKSTEPAWLYVAIVYFLGWTYWIEQLRYQRKFASVVTSATTQVFFKTNPWFVFIHSSYTVLFGSYTIGRTSWTSDGPVARPLPKYRATQTQNTHTHNNKHPCPKSDSNPRSRPQSEQRQFMP